MLLTITPPKPLIFNLDLHMSGEEEIGL
jgi:hypothetical protein